MLDRIKTQRRATKRETEWRGAHVDLIQGQDASAEVPADDALAARQRLSQIVDTVNDLPPAVREAFRLHKLEGLNHAETAAAMGVSRSSVEKYIMTSLKQIIAKVGR